MDQREFYSRLLPETGLFVLIRKLDTPFEFSPGKFKRWTAQWFDTQQGLCNFSNVTQRAGWFYGTANFSEKKRLQASAISKKCFYLDIDAGPEKFEKNPEGAYASQAEAIKALLTFTKSTGFTPSLIVSSGAGLHVYWELSRAVSVGEWNAGAQMFRELIERHDLRVDHSCTTDSARVLRPVGAIHKSGEIVRVLKDTGKVWAFEDFIKNTGGLDLVAPVYLDADKINDSFLNSSVSMPLASVDKILPKCGALREAVDEGGRNTPEPFWRAMLGLVKHCVGGDVLIHEFSQGHQDYDEASTQQKFDKWATGPTTCREFGKYSKECATCPSAGTVKSPITLGWMSDKQVAEAGLERPEVEVPPVPDVPKVDQIERMNIDPGTDKFHVVKDAMGRPRLAAVVRKKVKTDDGDTYVDKTVVFASTVFSVESWTEAGSHDSEGASSGFVRWSHSGQPLKFNLPNALIQEQTKLTAFLESKNISPVSPDPETRGLLQKYVSHQIIMARYAAARPVVRNHFGFQRDSLSGDMVCAQGKFYITKNGTIWDAMLSKRIDGIVPLGIAGLGESRGFQWPRSVWSKISAGAVEQASFFNRAYPHACQKLAIMLHLASPMMLFTADQSWGDDGSLPPTGFTVSLYSSKTGIGKTTVQRAAVEAFGHMGMVSAGGSTDMTVNAQIARAAMLGTYPYALDEATDSKPERVGQIVNSVAMGTEKMRSNTEGGLQRKPLTWALISSMSTNRPQRELLSQYQKGSDALQMRIMELNFDVLDRATPQQLAEYDSLRNNLLTKNAGSMGAMMAYYCVRRGWDEMRSIGQGYVSELFGVLRNPQDGRFFVRALAAVMMCHDALTSMGLGIFDKEELKTAFISAYEDGLDYRVDNATSGVGMVRRLVNDLSANILVTHGDDLTDARRDLPQNPNVRLPLSGRRVISGGYTYLSLTAVGKWCADNDYSMRRIIQDAEDAGAFLRDVVGKDTILVNLSRGVDSLSGVAQMCIKINDRVLNGGAAAPNVIGMATLPAPQALPQSRRPA